MSTRGSGRLICALVLASVVVYPAALAETAGGPWVGITENQQPNGGDLDGIGEAVFSFHLGPQQVCNRWTVQDIEPATADHVQRAPAPMRR